MPKSLSSYVCQSCGAVESKWSGQCGSCGEWNSLVEEISEAAPAKVLSSGKGGRKLGFVALDGDIAEAPRTPTGISELDRVLGGGIVPGAAMLLGGDPGIGKSTLLLQVAVALANRGQEVAYVTGEESVGQVKLRAQRLELAHEHVQLASATSVRDILASLEGSNKPDVLVIDSIQTMFVDAIESAPGTVTQVRASASALIRFAKQKGVAVFLVGHVTKDGQIAGPRVLEHMVDTVLYFEGERGHQFRILRGVKNRFGGTDEIGVFEMQEKGLMEVANPSALFLSPHDGPVSGSVVFAGMEGSRPILVEIQALVAPSTMATPRRAVVGWDSGRLAMLLAVLETRAGVTFSNKEVYLNIAGGFKVSEPAADLAVAAALVSALADMPVGDRAVMFGEIGLSGEVRQVSRAEARMKEAEKLGFTRVYAPAKNHLKSSAMTLKRVEHLRDLVAALVRMPEMV